MSVTPEIRHDWQLDEVQALFALPFNDLLFNFLLISNFNPIFLLLTILLTFYQ